MSLRYALLGLLSLRPMSGYEMKKVIDDSVRHFWAADRSQIYRTLATLVEEGLADRRTVVQDDRPNRHVHELTEEGLAAFDAWLVTPVHEPPVREPFLLRLFFADRLPPAAVRDLLQRRREQAGEHLAALQTISTADGDGELGSLLRDATLEYGISQARAEIAWAEATLRRLQRVGTDATGADGATDHTPGDPAPH